MPRFRNQQKISIRCQKGTTVSGKIFEKASETEKKKEMGKSQMKKNLSVSLFPKFSHFVSLEF